VGGASRRAPRWSHGYGRFCELYQEWKGRLSPTMRQTHVAGERLFVDYAGTTLAASRRSEWHFLISPWIPQHLAEKAA
jgi:transposase